jgi:hypothetical protein
MRDRRFRELIRWAVLLALALLAAPGCFTYSSYQSARIVERGEPAVTFALSQSRIADVAADDATWYAFETCLRSGVARRVDASFMLSIFHGVQEGWGAGVVTLDVRAGIIEDYLAFALPTALTIGDSYLASLRMQPGFIGTVPLGSRLEITGAARAHIFVRATDLFAMGYNVGLGIKSASGNFVVRPEVGWMVFEENEEAGVRGALYAQYGIGIEFRSSPKPKIDKTQGQ